ncbi:MAG: DEAD/DEAH box helicase [Rhodocyclaceae bacterium]|nr:DEAD/DEAH box helicase [Rhodocyclaceae bacterium]
MSFSELGLLPELLRAVVEAGYTEATPIQAQAIPVVLAGHDILAGAQTGTGKTAAFALPMLQRLAPRANTSASPARHPVRALILAPTRELAVQVHESVQTYCKHLPLRSACVYGGTDIRAQITALRVGVEIVVATPGRLLDHVQQKSIQLGQVEVLVLDEADRKLDMGFLPDIRRILDLLPEARQSLLFSATFSEEIRQLANRMLKAPKFIEVARRNTISETITHRVYPVESRAKRALLVHLLRADEQQTLVFVDTRLGCARLTRHLQQCGLAADAIHGDKNQSQRTETLEAFKSGKLRILVATDVAARGLDIDDLPAVINYELPHTAEDYVHRIGRTGRAGRSGRALSLVAPEEAPRLAAIEKLIKFSIPQEKIEHVEDTGGHARRERSFEERNHRRHRHENRRHREEREERTLTHAHDSSYFPPPLMRVAPDGFDFSKPYEPAAARASSEDSSAPPAKPSPPPPRHRRPIAALLGGLGRK